MADEFADKSVPLFCAVGWLGEFTHIDPSIGEVPPTRNDLPSTLQALAYSPDGILYAGTGRRNGLYKIDPWTGNAEYFLPTNVDIAGMAFSPSGELYVTGSSGARYLRTIDLTDGSYTTVGTLWGDRNSAQGLAFSPHGTLYAIRPNVFPGTYELLTIDLDDAQMHLLGSYSSTANVNQSITFTADGRLYAIGRDAFAQLNPTDGLLIGSHVTLSGDYRGLAIVPPMVYYVDDDAPEDPGPGDPAVSDPLEDGTTAHPFDVIQEAIDAAYDGDTIIVIDGTYFENINFNGKNIILRGTEPTNPDVVASTIIDGGGSGPVVTFSDEVDNNCVLNGFVITNGYASSGGGINCQGSSPTLANCIISGNSADWYGGGMYHDVGSPTLINCTFLGNSAGDGGGLYTHESNPSLTACSFIGNVAESRAGGLYNVTSNVVVTNCFFSGNSVKNTFKGGGGLYNSYSHVTLINCIISKNSAPSLGGAVFHRYGSLNVTNSTLISNSAGDGGGIYSRFCNPWISNSILWSNTPNEFAGELPGVGYSDIQGGWPGEGNINADPLFVAPGYWDANAVWIEGDYHLLLNSPCIDAGDPNYIAEPNETDLDGKPRIIGGRIDMGAYEFNHIPIADAGPDQTAYAWIDEIAEVTLDGTGSFDDDGQPLTYLWNWTVDGNTLTATEPNLTIELPVGEHIIELIVNDGIDDSEPNEVVITVIEPMEAHLWIFPRVINRHSHQPGILALLRLPEGITRDQIDSDEPLLLYPGGIEAIGQYVIQYRRRRAQQTSILAFFDKGELMNAIPDEGRVELQVVGQLKTGQYFFGTDTVWIIRRHRRQTDGSGDNRRVTVPLNR